MQHDQIVRDEVAADQPPVSFQQVLQILDNAIGGPDVGIGVHGAFWRGLTRDEFVAHRVFDHDLLKVGHGAQSNLVRALRGESPFGADQPDASPDAIFSRMPAGRPPVPAESIAVIEQWIDAGCPDEPVQPATLTWRRTNAPDASSRTDDIWFRTPDVGWAVNSNGQILHTTDGGNVWTAQSHTPGVYLRCVGFASDTRGWVGTLTQVRRMLETSDGGATWTFVSGLPAEAPQAVCGLSVVDENVVYASGTNFPDRPARMMRTVDGGASWTGWEMAEHATLLVDVYFTDAEHGWVVGGKAASDIEAPTRDDVRAVVLRTEDGGATWTNRLAGMEAELPLGEWGWKIFFLNENTGFIALESFVRGAILRTDDGGQTWTRLEINDPQGNVNLEGIGFIDEHTGWVGGWGSADFLAGFSSATTDGGQNWADANEIGRFINRFRFFGDPVTVGYASGRTVYKYSAEPPELLEAVAPPTELMASNAPLRSELPLHLPVIVPAGAGRLTVRAWGRFGDELGVLVDEADPAAGSREVVWDPPEGPPVGGALLVRITVDDVSESRIVQVG